MSLNVITGRSGQGKTEFMIRRLIESSEEKKDRMHFMVVPEQFSLEMQKKVIALHPRHGYVNIDVLSFHRLGYRIFEEAGFTPPDILEDLGVSMILRKILSQREEDLMYFKKSVGKPGFVDEIRSAIMELISFGVGWKELRDISEKISHKDSLIRKCQELSRVYQYFEEEVQGRYMVSEQILTLAGEMVDKSALVKDACFYFDGFTGFTPVQQAFLQRLASFAGEMNVSVTTPFIRPSEKEDLFSLSSKTMRFLMNLSKSSPMEWGRVLHQEHDIPPRFAGAPDLARLEKNIYQSHLVHEEKTGEADQNQTGPDNIHLVSCKDPNSEAEFVLHKIEKLVRQGYRYRDCAILAGDVQEYALPFKRQAQVLDIPLFVDVKNKLSYHAGVEAIRALFHLAETDYTYEAVFRYLKSGMSGLSDSDTDFLENYVLYAGIRGKSMWQNPFNRRLVPYTSEEVEHLHVLQKEFMDETEDFSTALTSKDSTVRDKMEALYQTMIRLSWPDRLAEMAAKKEQEGDPVKAGEYQRLFELLLELMDKIVAVFGEDTMSARELGDVMDTGLEALGLGIAPLSMDQLVLGDLKRTRLPEVKVLFIVGMNDGQIPPIPEERGLFSDEDKAVLSDLGVELSSTRYEQTLEDEFYTYLAFTRPSQALWFSMSDSSGDGKALRPSALLSTLMTMFPGLNPVLYPEEERRVYFTMEDSQGFLTDSLGRVREEPDLLNNHRGLRALASYWARQDHGAGLAEAWEKMYHRNRRRLVAEEYIDDLYGKELKGSVSRLETFAACPFHYFCVYGLNLREREVFELRPAELGSLFHSGLEHYSNRVKSEGMRWKEVNLEVREKWIDQALEEALDESLAVYFDSSARNHYRLHTVRRILNRTIDVITDQLQNSEFEPDRFELGFGEGLDVSSIPLEKGRTMKLRGIVDRVDICEEENQILLRVVDYKSGDMKLNMTDLYCGLRLQLAVYMNAAKEIYGRKDSRKVVPAGIFYYHLQDPMMNATTLDMTKYKKEFRMNGYANSDPDILRKLEDSPEGPISMNLQIKRDGTPYKNAPVFDTDEFGAVGDYVNKTLRDLGTRIYSGEISASPVAWKKADACQYCPMKEICGFDPREDYAACREVPDFDDAEVIEKIRNNPGSNRDIWNNPVFKEEDE